MPYSDTTYQATDTATLSTDSLSADSLIDSTRVVLDTVITYIPKGYKGIAHPSRPASEDWVFGTLLGLFLLLILALSRSSAWLYESVVNFFQVKERSSIFSNISVDNSRSRMLLFIFSFGVFGLYAYYYIFSSKDNFHFEVYLLYAGVVAVFFILKYLISQILGYVFFDALSLKFARESYSNIVFYLGISLFPLLFFQIYGPEWLNSYALTTALILCLIACILIIIKLFQIFFKKSVAFFYIMLYLCTLEILPLILLFEAFRFIK
jgi:hypothetical protein